MKNNFTLLLVLSLFTANFSMAQTGNKCGAVEVYERAVQKDPSILERASILEEMTERYVQENRGASRTVLTIPVVIHIIHNGEAVGVGSNISDAQAISQVEMLTEHFRKRNPDSLATTHPFYPATADCEIEFCLAKQDENGNPTSGITRYDGEADFWVTGDFDAQIKPVTIWDRKSYLNLWSTTFGGNDEDLDGYGTFPSEANDTTDGVVVRHTAFGRINGVKSIIATHEVGHYLNLLHIWGDNTPNCGDDLVADTPPAFSENFGCPTFPHEPNHSCGTDANGQMFMNYMDYSDDVCVVMYTNGQRDRMQAALTTMRGSLLTSTACEEVVGTKDVLVESIFSLYPNPTIGNFLIESDLKEQVTISVYNQLGAKLKEFTNVNSFPFEVSLAGLPKGVYFVSMSNGLQTSSEKIIVTD